MKHLPTITRLAIPAAMVSFLTIEIGKSQQATGWLLYLIYGAAFCTAVGIELWGIIAGDNLDKSWKLNHGRVWSVVQMIIYVIIGGWLLRHNLTIVMLPLVAALAYVASGFADSLDTAVSRREVTEAENAEWDREQEALDKELERRLRVADAKLKHEERMARIAAKARASTELAQSKPEPAHEQFECEDCNRSFGTVQALNAHGRFCPERVSQNGATK